MSRLNPSLSLKTKTSRSTECEVMLNEIYEFVKPDLKTILWSVFSGIIVYHYIAWRDKGRFSKEQSDLFSRQIEATITGVRIPLLPITHSNLTDHSFQFKRSPIPI